MKTWHRTVCSRLAVVTASFLAIGGCAQPWRAAPVQSASLEVRVVDASSPQPARLQVRVQVINRGTSVVTVQGEHATIELPDGTPVRATVPAEPRPTEIPPNNNAIVPVSFALAGGQPNWRAYPSLRLDLGDAVRTGETTLTLPVVTIERQ